MNSTFSRVLSLLTAGSMTLSIVPAVAAGSFPDVPSSLPYSEAIEALRSEGVIEGNPDGTFHPNGTINRAEFLKIILEARGDLAAGKTECFPDVHTEWFAQYVCAAKDEGIIQGYPDGNFKPSQPVNFVEAGKILSLAYDQPIDQYSPDWYEPYARALEAGNAIPGSIAKLDAPLTRGEMAEMMWRLSHNVSTKTSKAYLNVKYPEVGVNLATSNPVQATSCTDLRAFAEEAARGSGPNVYMRDDVAMPTSGVAGEKATMAPQASNSGGDGDHSETNVQVAGVDEGDIVKTDGSYLYTITEGIVRITKVDDPNSLSVVATLDLQKDNFTPTDLYIEGNRLVVLGSTWGDIHIMEGDAASSKMMIWPGPRWNTQESEVRIYSVVNKSNPTLERTVSFDGSLVSTRRIEDKLYLVLNQPVQPWGQPIPLTKEVSADQVMPSFRDSATGSKDVAVAPCNKVTILPRIPSPQYITVATFSLTNPKSEVARSVVLGSAENVYASLKNLYTASTEYQYHWNEKEAQAPTQLTHLYRFAFTDNGIEMKAKGIVNGHLLNQFSMDEHEESFRVATTEDGSWDGKDVSSNNLIVLNLNLEQVGQIEDIAPGERIYSVRFLGDRAYMVTFRTIDPLFVIDTSNPRNPTILGKLKIPGFSNYLHPYDETHIIGFGKDAVESKDGTFAWQQGMKVALFDVTDVSNPKQMHQVTIGDRGTDSPLLYNHKALLFDKSRNLLAFPVSIYKLTDEQKNSPEAGSAWGQQTFQGAQVYDLTLSKGFVLRGSVTHYTNTDLLKSGGYLYGKDIERIVRINDSLYTISADGIKSSDEKTVKEEGSVSFRPAVDTSSCPVEGNEATYQSHDTNVCASIRFFCPDKQEAFNNECGCGCITK